MEAEKRDRVFLILSTVLSTFTLLLLIVVLPMMVTVVQRRNTQLLSRVEECQVRL